MELERAENRAEKAEKQVEKLRREKEQLGQELEQTKEAADKETASVDLPDEVYILKYRFELIDLINERMNEEPKDKWVDEIKMII